MTNNNSSLENPPIAATPEITRYLAVEVPAIELPEFQLLHDRDTDKHNWIYLPLVLDRALGVGKTQQAFALVKNHHERRIVYCHNQTVPTRAQDIYMEV